ncbi:MAG: phosphoribosylformylglycinamidine cyclo-ligase [Nitrospinales bacterium]
MAESSKYAQSGVNGPAAENALSGLLKHLLPTWELNPRYPVRGGKGYFANVIDLGNGEGVAFCTDGVGTKMVVAELMGKYDTIGIDCVAMNVNDLICVGARPVSMVDYIACAATDEAVFAAVGKGLAAGARQANISICGGEISQIGDIISGIDLIGAAIGHLPIERINSGQAVRPGNLIVGLASSGVHANGLSLARKVLLGADRDGQNTRVHRFEDALGRTLGEELLEPTRIYVPEVLDIWESGIEARAMAHITGGGLNNLNRVAGGNIRFVIDAPPPIPPVFQLIQERGGVSDAEMFEVFNMGIGFCLVVEGAQQAEHILKICEKHETAAQVIGHVEACEGTEVTVPKYRLVGRGQKFRKV